MLSNFESQLYKEELKKYPKMGSRIRTTEGKEGKVVEVNILSHYIVIETVEKDDNEHIRNRIKVDIEEWLSNQKDLARETNHAENRTSPRRNNRVSGTKSSQNHSR